MRISSYVKISFVSSSYFTDPGLLRELFFPLKIPWDRNSKQFKTLFRSLSTHSPVRGMKSVLRECQRFSRNFQIITGPSTPRPNVGTKILQEFQKFITFGLRCPWILNNFSGAEKMFFFWKKLVCYQPCEK